MTIKAIEWIFSDPDHLQHLNYVQLLLLLSGYMYLLAKASSLIDYGSGMLLLVIEPGIICGLVLPILGALPDAATVLFSGLGPDPQVQINVGMGSLAGSSIMLLTLPWAAAAWVARVDLDDEKGTMYRKRPKLTKVWSLTQTGFAATPDLRPYAWVMLATLISYVVVVITSAAAGSDNAAVMDGVLTGFVLCCVLFVAYGLSQVLSHAAAERQKGKLTEARKEALASNFLSVADLFAVEMEHAVEAEQTREQSVAGGAAAPLLSPAHGSLQVAPEAASGSHHHKMATAGEDRMRSVIRHMFSKFDKDMSGSLDKHELRTLMQSMGLKPSAEDVNAMLMAIGAEDRLIQLDEFEDLVLNHLKKGGGTKAAPAATSKEATTPARGVKRRSVDEGRPAASSDVSALETEFAERIQHSGRKASVASEGSEDSADMEEIEEIGEEHKHVTTTVLKLKAVGYLALGVLLIAIFTSPMIDLLTTLGNKLNISPFYIAFVASPFVSNAPELLSTVGLARKRTTKSITGSLQSLFAGAALNNTMVLSLLLGIIYFRNLTWCFSIEVFAVLLIEIIMAAVSMLRITKLWQGLLPIALYPLSIGFVVLLEYLMPPSNAACVSFS